jgi:hypothetical protein
MSPFESTNRTNPFVLTTQVSAQPRAMSVMCSGVGLARARLLETLDAGGLRPERRLLDFPSRGRSLTAIDWTKSRQEGLQTELP